MLEASDLNDSAILAATTQAQDATGRKQLTIKLPSGRLLKSEWLPADVRANALISWCEAVRSAVVTDEQETLAKARRPKLDVPTNDEIAARAPKSDTPRNDPLSSPDALQFARQALQEAKDTAAHWDAQYNKAAAEQAKAAAAVKQWTMIVSSLEGSNV